MTARRGRRTFVALLVCIPTLALGESVATGEAQDSLAINLSGSISPSRLDPTKPAPVSLSTTLDIDWAGATEFLDELEIDYGKNVGFQLSGSRVCKPWLLRDTTVQAIAKCPPSSLLGTGTAQTGAVELSVAVFHGPGGRGIRLHLSPADPLTFDPSVYNLLLDGQFVTSGGRSAIVFNHQRNDERVQLSRLEFTLTKQRAAVVARCAVPQFSWDAQLSLKRGATATDSTVRPCTKLRARARTIHPR